MTTDLDLYQASRGELAAAGDLADWRRAALDWSQNLKSEKTRKTYLEAWGDFLAFVGLPPAAVTQSDVIAYKTHLKTDQYGPPNKRRNYSQSTVNLRLSAVSSFYAFAVGRQLRADNPVEGVKRESVTPYGKATWLSPEEGEDLAFVGAIDPTTDQGKRDLALALLYLTGAFRVSEVAALTVGSLRRQGRRLLVTYRRKGGEVEEVALATEAAEALDDYLATRGELRDDSPLFVATERGKKAAAAIGRYGEGEEKPLTTRAIRYLVKTYATKAFGSARGIRPHSLRHTAAQAASMEGATLAEVSRLLKHANVGITSIYLHSTSKSDAKTAALFGNRYGRRAETAAA